MSKNKSNGTPPATPAQQNLQPALLAPHSQDAEEAVLGSILINPEAYLDVEDFLKADDFFLLRNQWVYEAMGRLHERGELVEYLTVIEELRTQGRLEEIGGAAYITYLASGVGTSVHAEAYGKLIERAATRRRMLAASAEIDRLAREEDADIDHVISKAEATLEAAVERKDTYETMQPLSQAITADFNRLCAIKDGKEVPSVGLSTQLADFDKLLDGGFQPGNLVFVIGRPGAGKTALMLHLAVAFAKQGKRSSFHTLEMTPVELGRRVMSMVSGVNSSKLRRGDLTEEEFTKFVASFGRISELTDLIAVDYPAPLRKGKVTKSVNVNYIASKAIKKYQQGELDALFIDYMQLLQSVASVKAERRDLEIATMTKELKGLAISLNIPILVGAQMNRAIESRGKNAKPVLADIRESGAIENDGDIALFIMPDADNQNRREITIAKHRNGSTGDFYLNWNPQHQTFTNYAKTDGSVGLNWYQK